jgi:hypothetical protein
LISHRFFSYSLFVIPVVLAGIKPQRLRLKTPVPETREANRLHADAVKKRKDKAKETAARKRERKENHDKACTRAWRKGVPPPSMPESTEEEDSSTGGVDFSESDDFEVVTAVNPPPAPQRAGVEASASVLGERRLAPATLGKGRLAPARVDRRSPTPTAGRRSPVPATG